MGNVGGPARLKWMFDISVMGDNAGTGMRSDQSKRILNTILRNLHYPLSSGDILEQGSELTLLLEEIDSGLQGKLE